MEIMDIVAITCCSVVGIMVLIPIIFKIVQVENYDESKWYTNKQFKVRCSNKTINTEKNK